MEAYLGRDWEGRRGVVREELGSYYMRI